MQEERGRWLDNLGCDCGEVGIGGTCFVFVKRPAVSRSSAVQPGDSDDWTSDNSQFAHRLQMRVSMDGLVVDNPDACLGREGAARQRGECSDRALPKSYTHHLAYKPLRPTR